MTGTKQCISIAAILFWVLQHACAAVGWPLSISSNGRYLEDTNGVPFLIKGDSPWNGSIGVSSNEWFWYLGNKVTNGMNSALVFLSSHQYQDNSERWVDAGNTMPENFYGQAPFSDTNDWSSYQSNYWSTVRDYIFAARDSNVLVFATVHFLGYPDAAARDWYYTLTNESHTTNMIFQYGQFLANHFGECKNIIWVAGWDTTMTAGDHMWDMVDWSMRGIKNADPNALCAGLEREGRSVLSNANYSAASWLDMPTVYDYGLVWNVLTNHYIARESPTFMLEGRYEEGFSWTQPQLRKTAWDGILFGCGSVYGNESVWQFTASYSNKLNTAAWQDHVRAWDWAETMEWWQLNPDTNSTVLTAGHGSGTDYARCSKMGDGSAIIVYDPVGSDNTLTINLTNISTHTNIVASWFNPRTGGSNYIGTYPNEGSQGFNTNDPNDWVLYLLAATNASEGGDLSASLGVRGKQLMQGRITLR